MRISSAHTAASARSVAPFGGTRPVLGTNPIAFGMPSSRGPVVLDMGTSAFMGTALAYRQRLGQLLPDGVAVDAEGRPTRDPAQGRLGALLPFGGYKGFGLALIVQALGVLAGSALDPDKDDGYLSDRPDQSDAASARCPRNPHSGRAGVPQPGAETARPHRDRPRRLRRAQIPAP